MEKKNLRKLLLKKRNTLSDNTLETISAITTQHLRELELYQEAKVVALYYPFGSEISFLSLLSDEKTFVFPKIINNEMVFIKISNKTSWTKSSFGVMEPNGAIYDQKIDLMITPLLGINNDNYRIGYGKGYYDKFLENKRPTFTIAFVLDFQIVDFMEDDFDQSIDIVISIDYQTKL